MPLYDYQCPDCGQVFESVAGLDDELLPCPICAAPAKRLISLGHGGIQTDHPTWLDSARKSLQDGDCIRAGTIKPIETRSELKQYLKEHNYTPCEG